MELGRLGGPEGIAWAAATAVIAFGCLRRFARRRPGPWGTTLAILALVPPIACLVATILCFAPGAHPLVQYNDPGDLGAWSTWARLWPRLLIACIVGGAAAVALAVLDYRRSLPSSAWPLLALLNGVAFCSVLANFPSA